VVLFLDFFGIRDLDKIIFKCYSKSFNHYFLKMKSLPTSASQPEQPATETLLLRFLYLKINTYNLTWSGLKSKHTKAPTDKGYAEIYSNAYAFTAVKPDGSISRNTNLVVA
jgi:hypothetical protein